MRLWPKLVLVVCCMFAVSARAQMVSVCIDDEKMVARVRGIMLDAIDQALRDHTVHLFEVWARDEKEQPKRASVGLNNGIRAYMLSYQRIQAWQPQRCKPEQ